MCTFFVLVSRETLKWKQSCDRISDEIYVALSQVADTFSGVYLKIFLSNSILFCVSQIWPYICMELKRTSIISLINNISYKVIGLYY